jgi:hypothetical protein
MLKLTVIRRFDEPAAAATLRLAFLSSVVYIRA